MAWYNASWDYRVKVTVKATKVDADVTDFPVYVDLSDLPAGFHTNVNQTDARDIRVTKSDGTTEVAREVMFYDSVSDAGSLYFLASGATLKSATDVDFYIYYGNSAATEPAISATYGAENVWNANHKAVCHLQESGDGTSGEFKDSTDNSTDLTGGSSAIPTRVEAGLIGKYSQSNTTTKYINGTIDVTAYTEMTMQGIIRFTEFDSYDRHLSILYSGRDEYRILPQTPGTLRGDFDDGSNTALTTAFSDTASYHLIAIVYDGTTSRLFVDGTEAATAVESVDFSGANGAIGLFRSEGTSAYNSKGYLNQVKILDTGITLSWHKT